MGRVKSWIKWQWNKQTAWRLWDSMGGGKHAAKQIEPFKVLSRPSFYPISLRDPIFSDPHFSSDANFWTAIPRSERHNYVEYVYHLQKPSYIETDYGYVIMEPAILIPESLAWSERARAQDARHFFSGVPSLIRYRNTRQGKQGVRREPIVVSLRHVFDSNYGHCLIQLMTSLLLLDECGVSHDIPIVVSRQLGTQRFFQELIQRGALRNRRWIIQDDSYIYAQEIIFARTEWPDARLINRFLDAIEAPQGNARMQRRLFIVRKTRQLSNMDALLPILNAFEFEQVRPEELSIAEQMVLFSEAGTVCGTGGAALTNTIFRRGAPLRILQLCSSMETDLFFYQLAKTYGYSFQYLVGSRYEANDRFSNFAVEPERFRAFLRDCIYEQRQG